MILMTTWRQPCDRHTVEWLVTQSSTAVRWQSVIRRHQCMHMLGFPASSKRPSKEEKWSHIRSAALLPSEVGSRNVSSRICSHSLLSGHQEVWEKWLRPFDLLFKVRVRKYVPRSLSICKFKPQPKRMQWGESTNRQTQLHSKLPDVFQLPQES